MSCVLALFLSRDWMGGEEHRTRCSFVPTPLRELFSRRIVFQLMLWIEHIPWKLKITYVNWNVRATQLRANARFLASRCRESLHHCLKSSRANLKPLPGSRCSYREDWDTVGSRAAASSAAFLQQEAPAKGSEANLELFRVCQSPRALKRQGGPVEIVQVN